MTSEAWKEFKKKAEELREAQTVAIKKFNSFMRLCKHEEKVPMTQYYSGDYYDRASTDTWLQCVVCGERSDNKTRTHGYYG